MGRLKAWAELLFMFVVTVAVLLLAVGVAYTTYKSSEAVEERVAYRVGYNAGHQLGLTEGARQATLKCPYNYRMKP